MDLQTLRDSARSKADEQNTNFIDNTELDRFLNQAQNYVYGKIAQRFEDYFCVKGTALNGGLFNTVAGTQSYDLPSDLIKVVRVEHRQTGSSDDNDWRRLERSNINNDSVNDYFPVRPGYSPSFGYYLAGAQIHIRPVPQDAYTIRIWYIPRATTMALVTDEPSLPEEYHEMIAEYAAIQCLRKSGEGIWGEAMTLFTTELTNMLETIENRDQNSEQMVITDMQDRFIYGI